MKPITLAIIALTMTPGLAAAQDVYVDDEEQFIESPEVMTSDDYAVEPAEPGVIVGPRVYGWTALRPDDCGTFKYWNGDYCADARFDPPDEAVD